MLSYKINEFIELKLRHGKTYIYINGKKFLMCIRLAFQTPEQDTQGFEGINSINETIEKYDDYISDNKVKRNFNHQKPIKNKYMITPAQEFHAICSNIEAWVENNYDKRILLGSITLSLLKELIKAGEPLAKRRFQEEIATRLECAKPSVIQYLSKGDSLSLDYFSKEELQSIFETTQFIENIIDYAKIPANLEVYDYIFLKLGLYDYLLDLCIRILTDRNLNHIRQKFIDNDLIPMIVYSIKIVLENFQVFRACKIVLENNPASSELWNNLGLYLSQMGLHKYALKTFDFSTKLEKKISPDLCANS